MPTINPPAPGVPGRQRIMFMSEAWVLIAVTPVLYLLAGSTRGGLRLLMLAFMFMVIADGLLSYVLTRSIRASAKLPTTIDLGTSPDIEIEIEWPLRAPVVAHFTEGLTSAKSSGPASGDGVIPASGIRRGVVDEVTLTIAAGAFLGLIGFVSETVMTPAEPILVLPPARPHPDVIADIDRLATPDDAELIGVRPYRPGDRPGDVHWPSVARTPEIMVRERAPAPPAPPPLTVVVAGTDAESFDDRLAVARFAVEYAWTLGMRVTLVTNTNQGGKVTNPPLTSPADLHLALATATPGPRPTTRDDQAVLDVDGLDLAQPSVGRRMHGS